MIIDNHQAFALVEHYRKNDKFKSSYTLNCSQKGAAEYLARIAYPHLVDHKRHRRFIDAMLSALIRDITKTNIEKRLQYKLIEDFELDKLLIWRDIDTAITGKGEAGKIGGGIGKIIERFHAYHAFMAYDFSLEKDASVTFIDTLSRVSTAYESKGSALSDKDTRLTHLKRAFRQSRPVLHLTGGLIESFLKKGWCNDRLQLNRGVKPALVDPSWLTYASEVGDLILGCQLLEHESGLRSGVKIRKHKFEPSEVIDVHINRPGSLFGP